MFFLHTYLMPENRGCLGTGMVAKKAPEGAGLLEDESEWLAFQRPD